MEGGSFSLSEAVLSKLSPQITEEPKAPTTKLTTGMAMQCVDTYFSVGR